MPAARRSQRRRDLQRGERRPDDDRVGVLNGTLDPPATQADIPVIGTSFAVGDELHSLTQDGAVTIHLKVDAAFIDEATART